MEKIPLIIEFDTATIDEKIKAVIDAKKALDIAIAELDESTTSIAIVRGNPAGDDQYKLPEKSSTEKILKKMEETSISPKFATKLVQELSSSMSAQVETDFKKFDEFHKICEPLVKYMQDNPKDFSIHSTVIITVDGAKLVTDEMSVKYELPEDY